MTQDEKKWGTIKNYPNYLVSNNGEIKRIAHEIDRKSYKENVEDKILTPKRHRCGYHFISLSSFGKKKQFLIHRVVAESFIINTYNKDQVNHKNGIRTDNRIENLEWVTVSENHIHAFRQLNKKHPRHQLGKKGELSKSSIKVFCQTFGMAFNSLKEASNTLGISVRSITEVCSSLKLQVKGVTFNYINNG